MPFENRSTMPPLRIEPYQKEDLCRLETLMRHGFAMTTPQLHQLLVVLREHNFYMARCGDATIGCFVAIPIQQYFGGQAVAGVATTYGTLSLESRGRNLSPMFYQTMLEYFHVRGFAHTVAYPARFGSFRRLGYEIGGVRHSYELQVESRIPSNRSLAVTHADRVDIALLASVKTAESIRENGIIDRSQELWDLLLHHESEKVDAILVGDQSDPEGYLIAKQHGSQMRILDFGMASPAACETMLTVLNDFRPPATTTTWDGPPHDWFTYFLPDMAVSLRRRNEWMIRLIDVPRALELRGYPPTLAFETFIRIEDELLPWNCGTFRIQVSDGRMRVERCRGDHASAVRMHVRVLAAIFTGYLHIPQLGSLSLVSGPGPDLAFLAFAFGGPSPWMPDLF